MTNGQEIVYKIQTWKRSDLMVIITLSSLDGKPAKKTFVRRLSSINWKMHLIDSKEK